MASDVGTKLPFPTTQRSDGCRKEQTLQPSKAANCRALAGKRSFTRIWDAGPGRTRATAQLLG